MTPKIIIELLNTVYRYYPIGMPQITFDFEGSEVIKRIISAKINEIIDNKPTHWQKLVKEIKSVFANNVVSDYGYFQFPNYFLTIELKSDDNKLLTYNKYLVLTISLLTEYYTIYFEDVFQVKNIMEKKNNEESHFFNIAYFDSCIENDCFTNALIVKKKTESYFSEYKYISHKLMFDHKIIGGVKYGESPDLILRETSLFEFLFNNDKPPGIILK